MRFDSQKYRGRCLGPVVPNDYNPLHVALALENAVDVSQRPGVCCLVVDDASASLWAVPSRTVPGLRGVALYTCHPPMKYESVASNQESPGCLLLRRLVTKFNLAFARSSIR